VVEGCGPRVLAGTGNGGQRRQGQAGQPFLPDPGRVGLRQHETAHRAVGIEAQVGQTDTAHQVAFRQGHEIVGMGQAEIVDAGALAYPVRRQQHAFPVDGSPEMAIEVPGILPRLLQPALRADAELVVEDHHRHTGSLQGIDGPGK